MSDAAAMREQIGQLRGEQWSAEQRERAVHDVLQTIAQSPFNLDVVLQTVIDQAVHLCQGDNGNIARLDGEGRARD